MDVRAQLDLVECECESFQDELAKLIDPDWPADVRAVLRYLHTHLFEADLQISEACAECGIYSGRFRQIFKRCCYETMRQYCENKRLLVALRLLRFDELEISFIAFSIGYENYRTFGRAFKRCFGMPPAEIRAEIQQHACSNVAGLSADTELRALRNRIDRTRT